MRTFLSIQHRRLFLVPLVSIIVLGLAALGLTSSAASASQRPAAVSAAASASAHGTSVRLLAATTATPGTQVSPDAGTYEFEGYYSTETLCELEGNYYIGDLWGNGEVTGFLCPYNGEPGPLGPYELWLYVESSCGATAAKLDSPNC